MTITQLDRVAKKFKGWRERGAARGEFVYRFPTPHEKRQFERAITAPKAEPITVNGRPATHLRRA